MIEDLPSHLFYLIVIATHDTMRNCSSAVASLQSCVFFVLLFPAHSASNSCSSSQLKAPVEVPIQNVTFSNQLIRRAAALSFGSPPQHLAFGISAFVFIKLK